MATTTTHTSSTGKWTWKDLLFPLISGAFGLFLAIAQIGYVFVPWMPHAAIHDPAVAVPAMHLWHYAQAGMHGLLLLALPLFLLVWRPRQRVLLMQFLLTAGGLLALLIVPVRTLDAIPVTVALVVLTVLYPYRRGLAARPAVQRLSRPLLGLTLLLSPFLLLEAVRLVQWQIEGVGGEHATAGHWIAAAAIPLTLIIAGLLAATRQPGWRALGVITGLSFLYLGVAAIALPRHDGSWGTIGGAASLIAGATYLLLTYREGRKRTAEARSQLISAPAYGTLAALIGLVSLIVYAQVIRAGALGQEAVVLQNDAHTSP